MKKLAVLLLVVFFLGLPGCQSIRNMPSGAEARERQSLLIAWNPFKEKEIIPIWQAVIDHCTYKSDGDQDIWQSPEATYATKHGDCEDMNLLLASALLAEGYEAAIAVGCTSHPERWIDHAWVLLKLGGKYYYLDATWSKAPTDLSVCEVEKWQHWKVRYTVHPQRPLVEVPKQAGTTP